jgi:hypothetical protein
MRLGIDGRICIPSRSDLVRKHLLIVGFAAATLIPTFANAQQSCEERAANRVAGTVVGAGLGAIIGSAVAGRHDRGAGAVIGGISGGLIGNQASRGSGDCRHAYGYYDNNGAWHANAVARADARGYYDRNGGWIDGAPRGGWDNHGHWAAASANGYGYNASYAGRNAPRDIDGRLAWLHEKVSQGVRDGSLNHREARRALNDLDRVQRDERNMRRHGRLNDRNQASLQARLDTISSEIRWSSQN